MKKILTISNWRLYRVADSRAAYRGCEFLFQKEKNNRDDVNW